MQTPMPMIAFLCALGLAILAGPAAAQSASYARVSKVYTNYDGLNQAIELELVSVGATPIALGGRSIVVRRPNGDARSQVLPARFDGAIGRPFILLSSWAGDGSIYDDEGGDVRLAPDMIPVGGGTIEIEGMDTWTFGALPRTGAHAVNRAGEVVPSILNVHTNQYDADFRYVAEFPGAVLQLFYHAGMGDFFMTPEPEERRMLNAGEISGWEEAQSRFTAWSRAASSAPVPGTVPVCRFLRIHASGYTHFYTADAHECSVLASDPAWILESASAFHVVGADPDSGTCPSGVDFSFPLHGEVRRYENPGPLYRLWNGQANALHQFTTSKARRDALVLQGWRSEGYGSDGVAWCGWGG